MSNYNSALQSNNIDLQTILNTINELPNAGSAGGEQITPTISVDASGLITATAGSQSVTKQLPTQAEKTITPTKSSQTAVSPALFTTGFVTVAAIPNEYITTTDATASASEIMNGETAYVNGNKVTGTFSIDAELITQDDLITQIQAAVDSLPEASSGGSDGSNAELITGTVSFGPDSDPQDMSRIVYYTDLDGLHEDYINISPYIFSCIKNSIVHLEDFILKESSTGINTNPYTFGGTDGNYKNYVVVEYNDFNIVIT